MLDEKEYYSSHLSEGWHGFSLVFPQEIPQKKHAIHRSDEKSITLSQEERKVSRILKQKYEIMMFSDNQKLDFFDLGMSSYSMVHTQENCAAFPFNMRHVQLNC
jgi:hypothetical protein